MHFLNKLSVGLLLLLSMTASLLAQSAFSGGDGSESNPYKIATEADLRALASDVNNRRSNYAGQYFLQTADITFKEDEPIAPIGDGFTDGLSRPNEICFLGTYDGGMHKIYNLNLNDGKQLLAGQHYKYAVGLFGVLGEGATVKNVVIASGHIYGFASVGAIVGQITSNCKISRCKVGPDVRIIAWAKGGGIAGSSLGTKMKITECVNYANVNVYGNTNIHKIAGGIIGQSSTTTIEGCANFGDIWAQGGFAGGIVGYMPAVGVITSDHFPEIKSCINAGDISGQGPGVAGFLGAVVYNSSEPRQMISNSYNYGQTDVVNNLSWGPICAYYATKFPITVSKTFYNKNRFARKQEPDNPDAKLAFALGEPKSHEECISPEFIATLNDGGAYPFEADKHKINGMMPILKWINDTYDAEIDKPNQYRTDIKSNKVYRRAGAFFNPNRTGEFIFYDMSMQMPIIQTKSLGCSLGSGWLDRVLPVEGGETYTFFASTSAFRRAIGEDGNYVKELPTAPADHWLITPSFKVREDLSWFHWEGASEVDSHLSTYDLYVVEGAEEPNPAEILKTKPIFTVENEAGLKEHTEKASDGNGGEVDRLYYTLNAHKVDLSKYAGKEIRLAFRDRSIDKFILMIGRMKMAQANAINTVAPQVNCQIEVSDQTLSATRPESLLTLYSISGQQLAQMRDQLVYRGQSGVYILVVSDATGYTERLKVVLY